MSDASLPLLSAADLRRLAEAHNAQACPACAALKCQAWESVPGTFERKSLLAVGTLRDPGIEEPTLEEFHPAGTNSWSPHAPIALGFFPYNRCEVWQCGRCARPFLRYTEYGGYYVDERIRELDAALVTPRP